MTIKQQPLSIDNSLIEKLGSNKAQAGSVKIVLDKSQQFRNQPSMLA